VQRYYMLLLGKSFANFHPSLQVPILNVFEKAWMVSSHPTSSANA
jgi:hypothetical protein